jgi:NADH-quinone oxidoreductase subunit C
MHDQSPKLAHLRARLGEDILASHDQCGDDTIVIARDKLIPVILSLREDPLLKLEFLSDITAVDYWKKKKPRFELVYHLYSLRTKYRLRLKVPVGEEDPAVQSLTSFWKAANWLEREVWDMYGIRFLEHPDLRRVLLYEEFQGHPLRKDYPVNEWQPLVPQRDVEGTFVDERSEIKRLRLKQQFARKP